MRYEGRIYRPPSEANSYIVQATVGCSHNLCTYCDMYRDKVFRVRDLGETLEDLDRAGAELGSRVEKVFVADGDGLVMDLDHWLAILSRVRRVFPRLRQVSCYATAMNLLEKSESDLRTLCEAGLALLYIGPESGDPEVMRRIVKGATHEEHVEAATRARAAGIKHSAIFLLGAGGVERSTEHAKASARLATAMDPDFLAALTLTIIPGTPMGRLAESGRFDLPDVAGLLRELRIFVAESSPTDALFRTNHASNYLALGGRLPADRDAIVGSIDSALSGEIELRPEWVRGL